MTEQIDFSTPLARVVTAALRFSEQLESRDEAQKAELVRELCRRVVPIKIISEKSGKHKIVADPIPEVPGRSDWCRFCEMYVTQKEASTCKSRHCSLKIV